MSGTMTSNEKISEALKLLNEAAREKKGEFQTMIADKYDHLKEALAESDYPGKEILEKTKVKAAEAFNKAKEIGAEKAKELDEQVHKNPWPYIGGAAVVGLVAGLLIGRSRSR